MHDKSYFSATKRHDHPSLMADFMNIPIQKFGKMLISRPAGREAASIIVSSFNPATTNEIIELDFDGVEVIGPSWLDEVLTAARNKWGTRVKLVNDSNLSLQESLKAIASLESPDSV